MADYKILHDVHFRPLYLAYGDYRPHVDTLSFSQGWKQQASRAFLRMQYYNPFQFVKHNTVFQSVKNLLPALVTSPVRSAFFYDTSWYKETKAIGILETAETAYFVKIHAQPEDCLFEERQTRFVADMFSGSFITAPILISTANCLLFKMIPHLRPVKDGDHIEERLLHVTKNFLDQHAVTKNLSEAIPLNLYALCHGTPYVDLGRKIRAWAEKNDQTIRHIPVHGDMTPWNMFVNHDEKIVLVDYERAGWQVSFYDLFHYVLQPQVMRGNKDALQSILFKKPWFHAKAMRVILTLYLIDQFYHDLADLKQNGFNYPALPKAIEVKTVWLNAMLDD